MMTGSSHRHTLPVSVRIAPISHCQSQSQSCDSRQLIALFRSIALADVLHPQWPPLLLVTPPVAAMLPAAAQPVKKKQKTSDGECAGDHGDVAKKTHVKNAPKTEKTKKKNKKKGEQEDAEEDERVGGDVLWPDPADW